jgi:hypothetical protein
MINDSLSENDILDYLMTSDFNEGLTHEESKFLLLKYRYFYRMIYSKNENLNFSLDEIKKDIDSTKKENEKLVEMNKKLLLELESEKSRKLSWKERLFGQKNK